MSGAALVLVYHRIAALDHDPQHLAVHPDRFAEQLEALPAVADLVPLEEVLGGKGDRRVAVTFDDGYADNLDVAVPALRDAGTPATVFVTTGILGARPELWWDRLEDLVLHRRGPADHIHADIPGAELTVDVRTPEGRARAVRALSRRLRGQPPAVIDEVLDDLASQTGAPEACEHHRMLRAEDLRTMQATGLVTIGAHTRRHANLGRLPADAQREEIEGSRDDLRDVLGTAPNAFAYPFGMAGSFDRRTERLVQEAGFALACANVPGLARPRDRYRLPRHIATDVPGPELAARVARWLAG